MGKTEEKNTTTVAVRENMAVGVPEELMNFFGDNSGDGLQNVGREDKAMPMLVILQQLSPQCVDGNPDYNPEARPGMFYNTATKELIKGDVGVDVIPVYFEKRYVEWHPRDAGGGFVAEYGTKEEAQAMKEDDTDIVDTGNHYILIRQDDGTWLPGVLSCKSTMLSVSRQWNTSMELWLLDHATKGKINPPSYAGIYRLTAQRKQKDQNIWYVFSFARTSMVKDRALVDLALALKASLESGQAKIKYEEPAVSGAEAAAPEVGAKDSDPAF